MPVEMTMPNEAEKLLRQALPYLQSCADGGSGCERWQSPELERLVLSIEKLLDVPKSAIISDNPCVEFGYGLKGST